jgi:hypothetical protein
MTEPTNIQEAVQRGEGSTAFIGEQGVALYRLTGLIAMAKTEMEFLETHGTRFHSQGCPLQALKRELDLQSSTREDIADEFNALLEDVGIQGLVDRSIEVSKRPPPPRQEKVPGERNCEEVFHSVGGVFDITVQDVLDQLVAAFEGGTYYWCAILGYQEPSDPKMIPAGEDITKYRTPWGDGYITLCDVEEYHASDAFQREHEEDCPEFDGETWRLDEAALKRGLDVMAKKYKRHFMDMIQENGDADTADVFLQCCLFGKMVYG